MIHIEGRRWFRKHYGTTYNDEYAAQQEEKRESARDRLEELRTELRAQRISYGELSELQSLVHYIEPDDVELLEAAGVPEQRGN